MELTKCFTFYSYKGGSGRSTTTVNTLNHLIDELGASPEFPILLVDADLESSGLTFFFNQENRFLGGSELGNVAFDTTYILSGAADPKHYFRESTNLVPVPQDLIIALQKDFDSVEKIFEGVELSYSKWQLLQQIAEEYSNSRNVNYSGDSALLKFFDFSKFIFTLMTIEKEKDLSVDQKTNRKHQTIYDFLPVSTYTDISGYFNKEEGTIRFLGVDTRQNCERLARNHSTEAIEALIEACSRKNYKAVIFDSGAGTQSTAHLFQYKSDVIVYCMRPTMQFAKGTKAAIRTYKDSFKNGAKVILLPTAVPQNDENNILSKECFKEIGKIVKEAEEKIDTTFCTLENALCEVELFKWREVILGANYKSVDNDNAICETSAKVDEVLKKYYNEATLPDDAKKAYTTYKELAKRIVELSLNV